MAIAKDQKILASDWNTLARNFGKTRIDSLSKKDNAGDDSREKEGYFWVRSSGWNWPDFYDSNKDYITFSTGTELTLDDGTYLSAYRANTDTTDIPSISSIDWDLYRYDYSFKADVLIDDEVVYGGGLFRSTSGSDVAPLFPYFEYLDTSGQDTFDPNYHRITEKNLHCMIEGDGFTTKVNIYLQRGSSAEIKIIDSSTTQGTKQHFDVWLPPGYYRYWFRLNDLPGIPTFKRGEIELDVRLPDDNVRQLDTIRSFDTAYTNLREAGSYGAITASKAYSHPYLTDTYIDKKGETPGVYTGDW